MKTTVQYILQEHFDRFAASHPLSLQQRQAAEAMRDCRTPAMGGHVVGCPEGHVRKVCCNSCRHRNCPQCAAFAREKWLAGWKQRLLDCPYHHVTFTLPDELRALWRYNKREFGELLFRAGVESLRQLLADERWLGAEPGMLAGLHSWDQTLLVHPHLHVIVTAGGLDAEGRWRQPKKTCLLPEPVLMEKFRGKFCAILRRAIEKGKLTLPPDRTERSMKNLLNRLGRTRWNVDVEPRYDHARGVVSYLARYLKGGPIGNGRIIDIQHGKVRIRCRERRDRQHAEGGGRRRIVRLAVDDFLARLLEHIPPDNMQTVRPYGLYANSKRAELGKAREHFGQRPRPEKRSLNWYDFCEQQGIEPDSRGTCPVCGAAFVRLGSFPAGRDPPPELLAPGGRDPPAELCAPARRVA